MSRLEYYHNSSWLEHGGAPDKAARSAFVSAIDAYLKQNGKYAKNEIEDHVSGCGGLPRACDELLLHADVL